MVNMNDLMKAKIKNQKCTTKYNSTIQKIIKSTRIIEDLIIFDENREFDKFNIDFDAINKIYGDRTGYEIACNEIRIDIKNFSTAQIIPFLTDISAEFVKIYNKKIVLYMQCLNDCFELRFHTFREDESLWLNEDLNVYDIPIICYISN
ncbi:MAG: hypothetical protein Q4B84_03740 [Clostridia bacterium]|nr:hypothetical protein [Clostridia bacterium]